MTPNHTQFKYKYMFSNWIKHVYLIGSLFGLQMQSNTPTLKRRRISMHCHVHNLCRLHQVHNSYLIHLCVWNLVICIVLGQGENKIIFVLEIDDRNTTCVLASKGTHVVYLNLNFAIT